MIGLWCRLLKIQIENARRVLDTIPTLAWSTRSDGSALFFNQHWLDYTGLSAEQARDWGWAVALHPEESGHLLEHWRSVVADGQPIEIEGRLRRFDGAYRWFLFRATPSLARDGRVLEWFGTSTDIEDRKRAEDALRASEQNLRLIIDGIPGLVFTAKAEGEIEFVNQQILDYTGRTIDELRRWQVTDLVHPDDLPKVIEELRLSIETGQSQSLEHRVRGADGSYRWFEVRRLPERNRDGRIVRWCLLLADIHDRVRAEDALRASEQNLRLMVDSIPGFIATMNEGGELEVANRQTLEYFGKTIEKLKDWAANDVLHPDDLQRVIKAIELGVAAGQPFAYESRARRADGVYRWHQARCQPQRDTAGRIVRWYMLVTDVDERKRTENVLEKAYEEIRHLTERLRDENILLRDQIDQVFLFEEIVGSSAALKNVLASVIQVAPTDATVVIFGETGTGKELIARAIHKRSQRVGRPFVSVNCASIPPSLIASELFGHEKGAFTGAIQRRQGRFELANTGTIFLDEIGELPEETQVALLRVIQERAFERVGGNRLIPTDVRIIAATNRDLAAAIETGAFRADLFYRLNVFPIHVPPLKRRKEDIPILIEYFVKRYADKAGKRITKIDRNSLDLCASYDWPGNIRELQNIVERSVILCHGDTFRVEQAWLTAHSASPLVEPRSLTNAVQGYEKKLIEAALAESNGRVAGPDGAAAKLGIPRSTLDTKIKQLKIKRHTVR